MDFANLIYIIYILLAASLVAALYGGYLFWKKMMLSRLIENPAVRSLLVRRVGTVTRIKICIIFFCIALFAFTVLRPRWGEHMREVSSEGVDLLVALDVSRSMLARDVSPSRIERSRDAIRMLAESLRGDRIGLIVFAGEAFIQCPLTSDLGAFSMFLDGSGPGVVRSQGTDIGSAFEMAYRVFSKRRHTSRNLVIITDGEDHAANVDAALAKFRDLGVTVFTAAVGSESGEVIPLGDDDPSGEVYQKDRDGKVVRTVKNTGLLRRIADETGGEFIDISGGFSGVYRIIDKISGAERNIYGSRIVKEKKEQYQVFALLLAFLLMLELMLPERRAGSPGGNKQEMVATETLRHRAAGRK